MTCNSPNGLKLDGLLGHLGIWRLLPMRRAHGLALGFKRCVRYHLVDLGCHRPRQENDEWNDNAIGTLGLLGH